MKRIKTLALTLAVAVAALNPLTTQANSNSSITIDPVLKDTQKDDIQSYFYRTTDGDSYQESLRFLVRNKSKENVDIEIYPVNALTSSSGVIDYRTEDSILNSSIFDSKSIFTNYAQVNKDSMTLEPGEAELVTMSVKVPELKGTVLGGLGFKIVDDSAIDANSNFQIKQETVNVVATLITNNQKATNNTLQYGEITVDRSTSNYNIMLPTKLESKSLITKATVFYGVKDAKGNTIFDSPIMEGYNFTPNASVTLKLPWLGKMIEEDEKYTLKGQFKYTLDGEKVIAPFSKTFKVGNPITNALSVNMPDIITSNKGLLWLLIPALLLLLFFMRRKEYALYSNESLSAKVIKEAEEKELYDSLVVYKKGDEKEKGYDYVHIYRKKKKEYEYTKTIVTDRRQS